MRENFYKQGEITTMNLRILLHIIPVKKYHPTVGWDNQHQ